MTERRTAPLASRPVVWVLAQAVLIGVFLEATGRFEPVLNPDSAGYREMPLESPAAALSHTRTLGYPVFLRVVRGVTGTDLAAPYFHFAAFAAAAAGFCGALRSVGFSRVSAGVAASGLLYSRLVFEQVGDIVADVPAAALAVASVALLLVVVGRPGSGPGWAGLTAAVFLTYQTRPAYLFLVPFVPLVGLLLSVFIFRRRVRPAAGFAALLGVATAVPLLAFCGLRGAVAGHFGLVSFGGYNLIGVTGQFLDERLAEEVSPEVRPLARRMIERRRSVEDWKPPTDYWAMEEMYNPTVWTLAVPAAEELTGGDPVRVNRLVSMLGREIIRRRPGLYGAWLGRAGREAVRGMLVLFVTDRSVRLCLIALLGSQAWVVWRRYCGGAPRAAPAVSDRRFVEFDTLFWVGLAFAAAKASLVILVETPIGRYMTAALLFLPSAFALLTWYRVTAVFGGCWTGTAAGRIAERRPGESGRP